MGYIVFIYIYICVYTYVRTIISIIFTITIDIIHGGKDCNIMTFPKTLAVIFFANIRNIYTPEFTICVRYYCTLYIIIFIRAYIVKW